MATLLERVSALVSANLNWMLDKAMQANSPAMLDAYIRKAIDYLADVEESCATVGGNAKTLKRKADEYQAQADAKDAAVNALLKAGKDDLAEVALSQAKTHKRTADMYRGQAAAMDSQFAQLLDKRTKLQAKIELVKQQRAELIALLDLAKAKEINVKAYQSVGDLKDRLKDPDIAKVADSIKARLDKADAALQVQGEDLDSQMEEVLGQTRDREEIMARKRALGLIQ